MYAGVFARYDFACWGRSCGIGETGAERLTSLDCTLLAFGNLRSLRLADLSVANLDLKVKEAQEVLEIVEPFMRLKKVYELLARELELLDVQSKISSEAKG